MILFIDEYVSETKTKEMEEVSFVETSSVLDETDISMNVSIGGADGGPDEDTLTPDSPVAESSTWADGGPDEDTLIPSSPVAETSGSKPVQPNLPAAETPGHSQHSPFAETSGSSRPKPTQSCEVCSYSTTSRGNMYRHKRSVHSHEKHSCDTCSREYSAKYDLVEHVRTVHRRDLLISELCSKSFNGRKALSLHKVFVHEQWEKFKCQSCSQTFHSRAHYHGHINTHANSKPYTCVVCSKSFTYKSSLNRHLLTCAGASDKLKCGTCNKEYSSLGALRDHEKGKHGRPSQHCACGKVFAWRTSLVRHQKNCKAAK